jgi:hypothetical protein
MKCDEGRLQVYLDGALPAAENAGVAAHLEVCASCREALERLRRQGALAAAQLQRLDPPAGQEPRRERALARFWQQARPAGRAPRPSWAARWRPALIGLTVVAVVAILFSFAPVRQAAADFLGIFRVRKFAVIPVDPARLEHLSGFQDVVMAALGEPVVLREAGAPTAVADAAAAAALTGFPVRAPAYLPGGAVPAGMAVESGPAVRVNVDRDKAQEVLNEVGLTDILLPDVATFSVTADIAPVVSQAYTVGQSMIVLLQSPSPAITLPDGLDLPQMGEALLRFLGMPEADARRLAQQIDWTGTLIIPLPTNLAQFREVAVDGVTGLVLEYTGDTHAGQPDKMLLWQRDGIVYALGGNNVAVEELLRMADSLR